MVTQPQIQDGPRWTTMTVINAVPATSRDGREQWELTVRWEWTPTGNRYGQKIWVFQQETPAEITRLGAFTVQVERKSIVAKSEAKGGGFHEGNFDWQWHWKILAWDGAGVSAPAPAPAPASAPQATPQPPQPQAQPQAPVIQSAPVELINETEMRIMRQSTLKCASWMMVPMMEELYRNDTSSVFVVQKTLEISEMFLKYAIDGSFPQVEHPDAEVEF